MERIAGPEKENSRLQQQLASALAADSMIAGGCPRIHAGNHGCLHAETIIPRVDASL
jgi:hypothetical protein